MKSKIYKFTWIILAFHIVTYPGVAKAYSVNNTAKDILQKNIEIISRRPPMMADGVVVGKWHSHDKISEQKYISRIYINKQQYDTMRQTWKLEEGEWTKFAENRGIWDGSGYTSYESKEEYYTESGFRVPADFLVIYDNTPNTIEWGMWAFSLGVTAGDEHFAKPLLESETLHLRPEMEQVDGFKCYVIEGDTPDYYYTVWIDPNNGYLHRKIIGENDKFKDPEVIQNEPEIVKLRLEVTNVKIEFIDGIPMVTEAKRHVFAEYVDESTSGAATTEKIFNIVWNPDFEKQGAFKLDDVPNSTRVACDVEGFDKTGIEFQWRDGKIVDSYGNEVDLKNLSPKSLVVKILPALTEFNANLDPESIKDKMILVCFWNLEQRPSRNCILALNKRAQALSEKNVYMVFIQAEPVDEQKLINWLEENKIRPLAGTNANNLPKLRLTWGVKSLPWLILTDKNHIVQAEGFRIDELKERIGDISEK